MVGVKSRESLEYHLEELKQLRPIVSKLAHDEIEIELNDGIDFVNSRSFLVSVAHTQSLKGLRHNEGVHIECCR